MKNRGIISLGKNNKERGNTVIVDGNVITKGKKLSYEQLTGLTKTYRPPFKELSKKWKAPKFKRIALPDTTIYPKSWTYLVSNEKHPHTITLKQFRKRKLKEGDKIYFERGQVYNFAEYDVPASHLLFGAFGTGADPLFFGSINQPSWSAEADGYYSSPLATAPKWVTINDRCARQGETGWLRTLADSTSSTVTGVTAILNGYNTIEALANNAKLRQKEFNFRLSYEHLVTGYNTGTGVLTIGAGGVFAAVAGMPFKLYGQKQFATNEGDWWYDDVNNELWIKSALSPTNVRVITEDYAFNTGSRTNITIENIDFTQYFESAIECPDSPNVTISGVAIHDNRQNALMFYGNNTTFTLSDFSLERIGLNGVHIGAVSSGSLTDGFIDEIGLQDNIGWPVNTYWQKTGGTGVCCFWDSGQSIRQPDSVDMEDVNMSNLGYIGVLWIGDDHSATECVVHDFCLKWNDGAGFYSVHRIDRGTSTKNITYTRVVAYNGHGNNEGITGSALTPLHASGLYVDNGSELVTVNESIFYDNTDFGILCNWDTRKTTITNCTVFGNGNSQVRYTQDDDPARSPVFRFNFGNVLTGNIIVAADISYAVEVADFNGDASYNPFATGGNSNNNAYVRPYAGNFFPAIPQYINARRTSNTGPQTGYNLAQWQVQTAGDAGSTERYETGLNYRGPVQNRANTVRIAVNPTGSPIVFDASGYFSITGAALTASENIPAWGALVYIAHSQTTPDQLYDTFTAPNGTAIAGRAPAVGPIPTIAAGTHEILNGEMTSSVNGAVYWDIGESDVDFTIKTRGQISGGLNSYFRWIDNSNRFVISITASSIRLSEFNASATATNIWELLSGITFISSVPPYHFTVRAVGNSVKVWVDGRLIFDVTVGHLTAGAVGLLGNVNRQTDYVESNTP